MNFNYDPYTVEEKKARRMVRRHSGGGASGPSPKALERMQARMQEVVSDKRTAQLARRRELAAQRRAAIRAQEADA